MTARPRNRWTAEQLERCRALYEGGARTAEIGALFGVAGGTIAVMAWQNKWQRPRWRTPSPLPPPVSIEDGAAVEVLEISAQERDFNRALCRTIRNYWQGRGRSIDLQVEPQAGGVLGIRSKSVNGIPLK